MGGTTIAQEPATAGSRSMPVRAIEIDHVDMVLSPKEIAGRLGSAAWREANVTTDRIKVLWRGG